MSNIVRTSDRGIYKGCRQRWDYNSKIRQNWEYIPGAEALEFGTAIHAGLEVIYHPDTWNDPIEVRLAEAKVALVVSLAKWRNRLRKLDLESEFDEELIPLGRQILERYAKWAEEEDSIWKPIMIEQEFSVPIPVPDGFNVEDRIVDVYDRPKFTALPFNEYVEERHLHVWDYMQDKYVPVMYEGRIDLIIQNTITEQYWVWDHKTAKILHDNVEWLDIDSQASAYYWVTKRVLGIDAAGVTFNQLKKSVPVPPRILKSGKVSKDRSQKTSKELLWKAVAETGANPMEYQEFIESFEEPEFFRRIDTLRSEDELEQIGLLILMEAIDMLGDPFIYPNPGLFNCMFCEFKTPCRMKLEGSDDTFYLQSSKMYFQGNI